MRSRYDPVAVTAAITGGDVLMSMSPNIPMGAEAIAREAVAAAEAGATMVHIHGREEPDGRPSGRGTLLAEIVAGVREKSDVVICVTTGGSPNMSEEERFAGLEATRPDVATLNLGTMNYELFPTRSRWPQTTIAWEQEALEQSGETVFRATLGQMRRLAKICRELHITPELEAYDVGHLSMARFLIDEGTLETPVRLQLVLGVLGGTPNALDDLFMMKQAAERILGPDLGCLGVAATGYPMEFRHCAAALGCGLDCRVGFEDSLRVRRDASASSNAEFVEVVMQLARLLGRPICTPQQLRSALGPWRRSG